MQFKRFDRGAQLPRTFRCSRHTPEDTAASVTERFVREFTTTANRDIKPEHTPLERGHAIVAVFGIARAVSTFTSDTLTQTGMSVGTPAFMSPE